jgi:hypothetical protein
MGVKGLVVDTDFACDRFVPAEEETDEGTLACSRDAYDADVFTRGDLE